MAIHIENLKIEQFRGIRQLSVPHLNHINLIVGDNNCGKTSFLEALLLLRDPGDFTNTLRIARMRDSLAMYGGISAYESLLTLFPHSSNEEETARMLSPAGSLQRRGHPLFAGGQCENHHAGSRGAKPDSPLFDAEFP